MKNVHHWSPRYLKNRLGQMIYSSSNPDKPWLTPTANEILESYLKPTDIGVEFGSGRSTIWFARRLKELTSVEHHELWYHKVQKMFTEHNISNVDYHLCPKDADDQNGDNSSYVKVLEKFEDNSVDFALVDGQYRDFCALKVLDKLKPGGLMVIDNVNWYLPQDTHSPNSRTPEMGPDGETWKNVHEQLQNWRTIWTSSGVWDTAFFIKPCS